MPDRRAFLKFLAASPLLAGMPAALESFSQGRPVAGVGDALDVFDLEIVAQRVVPPAHWGYLATGVDGDETLRANREAFARYQLRTRRFVDVSRVDLSTQLLGMPLASPIVLCPVGSQKAFHVEGEVATARAAKAKNHLQILSTVSSTAVEDVARARGGPIWFQLYTTDRWAITTALVKRAEAAGCPVVAVTVDLPAGRNTETATRLARNDTRVCTNCHRKGPDGAAQTSGVTNKPMFSGIDTNGVTTQSATLTWDAIKRLRDLTAMKVVVKGLETREDAAQAVASGADGIIVSNHGGRATETGRPTLEALPEVVEAVAGRIPVLLDGGVRRGTDVFKALALGASAVGIGRPYIWGLSAFGQAGVERVLDILNEELRLAMVGCGARSLGEIAPTSLIDAGRRRL
ncbi:MAG: alpha-hydroxy acid oxidase [Acidobacteriota bacterium]